MEVSTTAVSKQDGFGRLKVLLSQGRLALPRHPRLLGQLSALEFEERESGAVRIEVPQRAGHDDLAMALCLSVSVGDVASLPGFGRMFVAEGQLPKSRWDRRMSPAPELGPVVVKDGEKPRPRPGSMVRVGKFLVDREHYTPPSRSGWR